MVKKIWKKIYYSLIRNVPFYEINNDKNNAQQQERIEKKILELLTSKSFKITNPSFLKRDEAPVYKIPGFMTIHWPKGTDESYFKSYQILEYYQNIGMVKFKLTLKHDVSKEFNIKGFDTWEDILKQTETQIINLFNQDETKNYLASWDFKVKVGAVDDNKLETIILPLWKNYFLKRDAIKIKIGSIDYNSDTFTLEIAWDLDKKFNYTLEITSQYVKYLNEQRNILTNFVNNNEQLEKNFKELDYSLRTDKNYLQNVWNKNIVNLNDDVFNNLEVLIVNEDESNEGLMINFHNRVLDLSATKFFFVDWMRSKNEATYNLKILLNNYDFLFDILELYEKEKLNEENISVLFAKWNLGSDEYTFKWKKHNNNLFLMVEVENKKFETQYNNLITLRNNVNIENIFISKLELYDLTINDLVFQKNIIDNFSSLSATSGDTFEVLMKKYEASWKEKLIDDPFSIQIQSEANINAIKLKSNVSGAIFYKNIYSKELLNDFAMQEIFNTFFKNTNLIQNIKKLSFNQLQDSLLLKEILRKNNFYYDIDTYKLKINIFAPYNAIKVELENYKLNKIQTKYIDVASTSYGMLLSLKDNIAFKEDLANIIISENGIKKIDQSDIQRIVEHYSNGINFKGVNFTIESIENNPNAINLIISFDYIYPDIKFEIIKSTKNIDLSELFNELTIALETYISNDNNLIVENKKDEYSMQEILSLINDSSFDKFNDKNGKLTITKWFTINDPRIFFEFSIQDPELFISSYTVYYPALKEQLENIFYNLYENNKEYIKEIANDTNFDIKNEKMQNLLKSQKFPKWFKINLLDIVDDNNTIKFLYGNKEIAKFN